MGMRWRVYLCECMILSNVPGLWSVWLAMFLLCVCGLRSFTLWRPCCYCCVCQSLWSIKILHYLSIVVVYNLEEDFTVFKLYVHYYTCTECNKHINSHESVFDFHMSTFSSAFCCDNTKNPICYISFMTYMYWVPHAGYA